MIGYNLFNCFIEDSHIGYENWENECKSRNTGKVIHDGFIRFMKLSKPGDTVSIPDMGLYYTVCGLEFQPEYRDEAYALDYHPNVEAKVTRVKNNGDGAFLLECEETSGLLEAPNFTARVIVNGDDIEITDLPTEEK